MPRAAIEITGLVQGVGFRPYVYALATALDLKGFVQNRGGHVLVDVEGDGAALRTFLDRLPASPPPHARIAAVRTRSLPPAHHRQFSIARGEAQAEAGLHVPPDLAVCECCAAELFDPADRRFRHPFISCTACGPRFTIIDRLPYERARTTMARFVMCRACRAEYEDPRNRRFHAQTIACHECGPVLTARHRDRVLAAGNGALALAADTIAAGGIVAIKGLGGYHLACDARHAGAVAALRRRKGRDDKPMAVMAPASLALPIAAQAGAEAVARLTSPEHPIVLVPAEAADSLGLASGVTAGSPSAGILLPYTPLHHLLAADLARPLVMTSGNYSDEPMAIDDEQASRQLAGVADLFVTHDRRIEVRCDDSVVRVHAAGSSIIRRSRGYAPEPVALAEPATAHVLAVGGDLKNTICLLAGAGAYLSAHIGSLDTAAAYAALQHAVVRMGQTFGVSPEIVAHDLHPGYLSTRLARELAASRHVAVQHHHAHVLSCVAEHRCTEPVIGVVFDGTGYGADGAIWGGEFLIVDGIRAHRVAHLAYVPMPGGDAAIREPWRMAVAHLAAAFGPGLGPAGELLAARIDSERFAVVRQMIERAVCTAPTSSVGRLFDAVASIAGLCDAVSYEGQAAMRLEAVAGEAADCRYAFAIDTAGAAWRIDAAPVIQAIAGDIAAARPAAAIAGAFHDAVAEMIASVAAAWARQSGIRRVALSGGVFQNARIAVAAAQRLGGEGLTVLQHRRVPCNDGGLSLGQALLAARLSRQGDLPRCA